MTEEERFREARIRAAKLHYTKNRFLLHLKRVDYWMKKSEHAGDHLTRRNCMDRAETFISLADEANERLYREMVGVGE